MLDLEPMSRHTVVQWDPEPVTTEIGGEVVAMCARKGVYIGLDRAASAIWKRLETPQTIGDLCLRLTNEFQGDSVTIETDVIELMEGLREQGMVRATGAR